MKKSVLSLIALAIASVSVFTSCDKNDDGYGQSAKPQTQVSTSSTTTTPSVSPTMASTAKLSLNAFAISEEIAQLGTFTVVLTDGSKSAEYDIVKQGKFGTYKATNGMTYKGYVLAIAQPYSPSIKTTIKYTLNDKAKSMTKDDMFKGEFGSCHTTVTDPNAEVPFVVMHTKEYAGDHIEEFLNGMATIMSM